MAKNTPKDLHDHLFMRLEALSDEDLKGDALDAEIKRSRAVVDVAAAVIDNARVVLAAEKHVAEYGGFRKPDRKRHPMLTSDD